MVRKHRSILSFVTKLRSYSNQNIRAYRTEIPEHSALRLRTARPPPDRILFSEDNRIAGRWEDDEVDGWKADFDLVYTRVREAALAHAARGRPRGS